MSARSLLRLLVALTVALAALAATSGPAAATPVTVTGSAVSGTLTFDSINIFNPDGTHLTGAPVESGTYTAELEPGTYVFVFAGRPTYSDNEAGQYVQGYTTISKHNVVVGPEGAVVDAPAVPTTVLDVDLVDSEGNDIPATRYLECRQGPTTTPNANLDKQRFSSSQYDPDQHLLLAAPTDNSAGDGSGCLLILQPTEAPYDEMRIMRPNLQLDDVPTQHLELVMPELETVTGHITAATEPPYYYAARVQAHSENGTFYNLTWVDEEGNYSIQLPVGDYHLTLPGGSLDHNIFEYRDVTVPDGGTTLDSSVGFAPYTVHVVGPDGEPAFGYMHMDCRKPYKDAGEASQVHSNAVGTGELSFWGTNDPGYTCTMEEQNTYPYPTWVADLSPNGGEVTFLTSTGKTIEGSPTSSNDADGVPDVIEALGPNDGDGNNDGTPDNEQAHVTSLPANGGTPGEDATYLTLAGPSGSKLVDVSTSNVADAATPPPAGTTLPAGLTSFTLDNIATGSTQTVAIHTGDLTGVNGYAKYDPDTETWSTLPADRVQVFANRVEISLTDGGIGDGDGAANGKIVDPGGIAVLPASTGDTTPPVVTGKPTTKPNAAGWYRANVRIDWAATDPGSGVKTQPADTTVSTEGANVTATSPLVCDKAPTPNCGRGTVTGLKIDKTAPVLTVTGVTNGATYVLGSVPTPGCKATDPLSGLARPCAGAKGGGNSAGVGVFTYGTTATDKAGNTRVAAASYRVTYRFDGFDQPLNDPATPMSVFKAGSTVPAAFILKRANGTTVSPATKPVWVSVVRGARTTAAVNEPVSTAKATTGSNFVLKNGRWTFGWGTKGLASGYVYRIGVRLDDGTTHYLNIGLR